MASNLSKKHAGFKHTIKIVVPFSVFSELDFYPPAGIDFIARMAPLAAPEPINATTDHSKIRVSITLSRQSVVAGRYVTGKMEVECKSDKLGIGVIMVELFAFQGMKIDILLNRSALKPNF